jgi:UPF0716 protein FxsA
MITGRLLLLFTVVPLVELLLLVEIGGRIGAGPTILLVLATGVVGAGLARREGTRSFRQIQASLARGSLPARELFHGLLSLLAGAFLVTPGVPTDLLGFTLLVRPARDRVILALRSRLEERITRQDGGWSGGSAGRGVFFSFGTGTSDEGGPEDGTGPTGPDGHGGQRPRDDGERGRVIEM